MAVMTKRDQQIIDAYQSWDGDSQELSVDELAAQLGVSRQRLYQVLSKHSVPKKSGKTQPDQLNTLQAIGQIVMDQLFEAREELRKYREIYGPLD